MHFSSVSGKCLQTAEVGGKPDDDGVAWVYEDATEKVETLLRRGDNDDILECQVNPFISAVLFDKRFP